MWKMGNPLIFRTRAEARFYAEEHFAWHRRPDMRAEPHGWRFPRAVRVDVIIREEKGR